MILVLRNGDDLVTTVTQRIRQIKQPRGGYLPVDKATVWDYGGVEITDIKRENISPQMMGVVVDYLTRFYVKGGDASEAFDIALVGGVNVALYKQDLQIIQCLEDTIDIINNGKKLSDGVIEAACYLASMDPAYRVGPEIYDNNVNYTPDRYTYGVIRELVERSIKFFNNEGPLVYGGFELNSESSGQYIDYGDGDFMTETGLWDMKVSKNPPTRNHTIQVLIYYLMGLRSKDIKDTTKNLKRIGLYNPRLNKSFYFCIDKIDEDLIGIVERDIIGY